MNGQGVASGCTSRMLRHFVSLGAEKADYSTIAVACLLGADSTATLGAVVVHDNIQQQVHSLWNSTRTPGFRVIALPD